MAATSSRLTDYPLTHQGVHNLDQPRQVTRDDPMRLNVGENERTLSALGGGALMTAGLIRGGLTGLVLMWTGAGLLLRGVTGHCMVNEALGRDTA